MAKQTKITIETDRLLVVGKDLRSAGGAKDVQRKSEMIVLESVGLVSNLTLSAVEEWINSEQLHRWQAADGAPLVCLNSRWGSHTRGKVRDCKLE
jgi:hypothetical protein